MWAVAWPLQIDTFIGVGELALFVALADGWTVRSRAGAWAVTVLGLAVSVAGNVGHIAGHDLASRATAAVPPLAAAAALAVGLGVLKRVVGSHETGNGITGLTAVPGAEFGQALADSGAGFTTRRGESGDVPGEPAAVPGPAGTPAETPPDPGPVPGDGQPSEDVPDVPEPPAGLNGHAAEAAEMFAADLAAGRVPSIRDIRTGLRVGQDKATEVQTWLRTRART